MKRFKKMMAVAIAAAMIIGTVSFGTFAAQGDMNIIPDSSVTVSGLASGDVAKFYKIIEWKGITDQNKNDPKNVSGWYAVAPFDTVLTPAVLKAVLIGDSSATPAVAPTGITAALAGQLAKKINSSVTADDTITVTSDKAEHSLQADEKAGMYMVVITPTDANTVYSPVFVSSDYFENDTTSWIVDSAASYSDLAAAKKSTLKLLKTPATSEDAWDDHKPETTSVGDTVTFTVKTTIPGYGEVYNNPSFILKDTLKNLSLDTRSIKVDPATYTKNNTTSPTYTVSAATSAGYTITFEPDYLKTLSAPVDVTVKYDAKVTQLAGDGSIKEEDNQVQITYSHNPSDENDYDVKKDTTQHYTFTIDAKDIGFNRSQKGHRTSEIVKVGVDGNGDPIKSETVSEIVDDEIESVPGPLSGAVFGLFTDSACQNVYYPKNPNGTSSTEPFTVTSGDDGRMTIPDLDAGTYYLKEITAPQGFIPDPSIHTIEIEAEFDEVDITEYWDGNAWHKTLDNADWKEAKYSTKILKKATIKVDGTEASTHLFTYTPDSTEITWVEESAVEIPHSFVNTKGIQLPATGGMGTTLFYLIGAILIIGAGVLLVTRRRVEGKE
jgi:fimbrial isopeptide formation D2 family protein/LPXTG-motif cell wall-anchored protein